MGMEQWWNDAVRGKLKMGMEQWWNDADRGKLKMGMEQWWNDAVRGKLKMGMEQWWNDAVRGKLKYWEENLSQCHCVCFWRDSLLWARASSFTRFLDHTQRPITVTRTPQDE